MGNDVRYLGRRIHKGRRIELRAVDVPDGRDGSVEKELVIHPGSVGIVASPAPGSVVLIRNNRFAVGRELWEFPAGTLEPGEDPGKCAARELAEETGYEAGPLERLGKFYLAPGYCTELMHGFYTECPNPPAAQELDAGEEISVFVRTLEEVRALASAGEIEDAKSLALLALLDLHLRHR